MEHDGDAHETGGTSEREQMVPYSRFQAVVQERNTLRGEMAELRASLTEAQRQASADLEAAKAEAEQAREALAAAQADSEWRGYEVALAREGVADDDLVDYVRHHWSKVQPGEDGARPEFGAWLGEFRASKPTIFGAASAPQGAEKPAPPRAPRVNAGAKPAPPDTGYSPEQLAKMSQEEYRANKAKIREAIGVPVRE